MILRNYKGESKAMKKEYVAPVVAVWEMAIEDAITTSPNQGGGFAGDMEEL